MKTLNVRFLVIILLFGGLLLGVLKVVHHFQVQYNAYIVMRKANECLTAAEAYREQGLLEEAEEQTDAAIQRLRWYVGLRTKDAQALQQLGFLLSEKGKHREAFDIFEKLMRVVPMRSDARRELVTCAIAIGRYTDARVHLERYLLRESPDDPVLLEQLGRCQEDMLEPSAAAMSYEWAINRAPDQLSTYELLADVLRKEMRRRDKADDVMLRLVDENPDSLDAHLIRGKYLLTTHRPESAMEEAKVALELSPDHRNALWLAARCALALKRLELGRDFARRGIELYRTDVPLYATLANIELTDEQRDAAIVVLQSGLKATAGHPELLWNMGSLLIDAERLEEAEEIVKKLRGAGYPAELSGYLTARIAFRRRHWRAACDGFERARGGLVHRPSLIRRIDMWLGECYEHLENPDREIAAYRRVVTADRLFAKGRIALAKSLTRAMRIDEALAEYSHLARPPREAMLLWAQIRFAGILHSDVVQRNWAPMLSLLDEMDEELPGDTDLLILRTETLIRQGRFDAAAALLARARKERPKDTALRVATSVFAQRQEKWEEAEAILDEAETDLGDSVDLRIARAQYFFRRYGKKGSERLTKLAEEVDDFSTPEKIRLGWGLVGILAEMDDIDRTRGVCERIAEIDPQNVKAQLVLFELAHQKRDIVAMKKAIAQLDRIEHGPLWRYARAALLCREAIEAAGREDQKFSSALALLGEAAALRPRWERIPLLSAEIHAQRMEFDLALKNYLAAIDLGARDPGAIRGAVKLLYRDHRLEEANSLIERFHATGAVGISPLIMLQQGKLSEALDWVRKAAAGSDDENDFMLLGQVLALASRKATIDGNETESLQLNEEAEIALRHAAQLHPARSTPWLALVQFLVTNQRRDDAIAVQEEARKAVASEEKDLIEARCWEAMGDLDKARACYEKALRFDAPGVVRAVAGFYLHANLPGLAEVQLRRMLRDEPQNRSNAAWSRRQLAILLDRRATHAARREGIQLLHENLSVDPTNLEDRRLLARLTAHEPGRQARDEAVAMFEMLVSERPDPFPGDLLALADLHCHQGDRSKARDVMFRLLALHGDNPVYVAKYIRILLDDKDRYTTERWLRRLEELSPNSFLYASLLAEHKVNRGKYDEAITALRGLLEDPETRTNERRVGDVARRFAELGYQLDAAEEVPESDASAVKARFFSEAEKLLRRSMETDEEDVDRKFDLANFLARTGRIDESLDILEKEWKNASPRRLGKACEWIVTSSAATAEQCKQAERVLERALAQHDRPAPLLLALAHIQSQQEQFFKAEDLYWEIVGKDPQNVVAMNNLAVILALQGRRLDVATGLMNKALAIAGPVPSMLDSRATVHLAARKSDKAMTDIKEAIAHERTPLRLFHLARIYKLSGRYKSAAAAFRDAEDAGLTAESVHPMERTFYDDFKSQVPD